MEGRIENFQFFMSFQFFVILLIIIKIQPELHVVVGLSLVQQQVTVTADIHSPTRVRVAVIVVS
jgi:hypothetical protein